MSDAQCPCRTRMCSRQHSAARGLTSPCTGARLRACMDVLSALASPHRALTRSPSRAPPHAPALASALCRASTLMLHVPRHRIRRRGDRDGRRGEVAPSCSSVNSSMRVVSPTGMIELVVGMHASHRQRRTRGSSGRAESRLGGKEVVPDV